jgi:ATP-dependent helicase/nuclease subunit A
MNANKIDQSLYVDAQARIVALDPAQSFIVQAPAGSGKTELLIQRMLSLLALVNHPSEVLAITFTRKAAGEMRERLLSALNAARNHPEPNHSPAKERWQLARAVITRDLELNWRIADHPALLSIDTFDAFSLRVTKLAPLSGDGVRVSLATLQEDASELHTDAARRALLQATLPRHVAAVSALLEALDNRISDIISLIAGLLGKRAQWIHNLIDDSDEAIAAMRAVMVESIEKEIARLCDRWPTELSEQATALAAYAAEHATDEVKRQHWLVLSASTLSAQTLKSLDQWHAVSAFALTGDGSWRKQFNVRDGFAAASDKGISPGEKTERAQAKKNVLQFIEDLQSVENSESLRAALIAVRALPDAAAIAAHEPILRSALYVLKIATAELALLEQERAATDFSGVAITAKLALLEFRDEVFERLDTRIHHVLIDEFQDTNPAQSSLVETLTEDWRSGDGRTLFLVGDPMQSIYGFRDADVGIFMDAWLYGIGNIRLKPLTLSANYRSRPNVVEWVNTTLEPVFAQSRLVADAPRIHFARATATRSVNTVVETLPISPTLNVYEDSVQEATALVSAIMQTQRTNPTYRIAVIVRAKKHGNVILRALQDAGIAFVAREMAPWADRVMIRDLLSLTYVLAQPSDRLSWYAWLRSPMVGLTLATFARLSEWQIERKIETEVALRDTAFLSTLSTDERQRIEHAITALTSAYEMSDLGTLAERVHAVFHLCSGDVIANTSESRAEVEDFLAFLDDNTADAHLPPRAVFEAQLNKRFQSFSSQNANSSQITPPVEILTIHKAKGLEWDSVFLPQMDRVPPPESRALIVWDFVRLHHSTNQRIDSNANRGSAQLLVGAKEARRRSDNSVFQFVHDRRVSARAEESKRLLYVAATRAREQLWLSRVAVRPDKPPSARSLAALIDWPQIETCADQTTKPVNSQRVVMRKSLARLQRSPYAPSIGAAAITLSSNRRMSAARLGRDDIEITAQQANDIALGIVGHKLLEGFACARNSARAHDVMNECSPAFTPSLAHIVRALITAGAQASDAPSIAARLMQVFKRIDSSMHVETLFSATHKNASNELTIISRDPVSKGDDGTEHVVMKPVSLRVDRTFVTDDDKRWIVDYKFSEPSVAVINDGAQLDRWLKAQSNIHLAQLTAYTAAFASIEPHRHIVQALYFPLIDKLLVL